VAFPIPELAPVIRMALLFKEFTSEFRSSGVQEFRSSGVQEFRSSGVQGGINRREQDKSAFFHSN
jgi:hypothetical protein